MEFRFAATQLRLPLIIAVVGTGDAWETTEVMFVPVYLTAVSFGNSSEDDNRCWSRVWLTFWANPLYYRLMFFNSFFLLGLHTVLRVKAQFALP